MKKALHFCAHPGCSELTTEKYCAQHAADKAATQSRADKKRGSALARGYDYRWQKYSKAFLARPENQICKLGLPGCILVATCVDHIKAVNGPKDPLFWDKSNHQASCLHCNSVKGHKYIKGTFDIIKDIEHKA